MRKYILLSLLLSACLSVYSQSEFADVKDEVNSWYAEITSTSTLSSKTPKSILYTAQHYLISGVVSKGILCEGTIAKFYDISSLTPNLLLEGRVSYQTNRLVVEGIKYFKTPAGIHKIYGTFYVYNMDDYSLNYKPKMAGQLRIKCSKASYLEGFYSRSPVLVRLNDKNSSIYIDGQTGGKQYSFLSAEIPNYILNDDDTFDVVKIILLIGDHATLCDEKGMVFKGRIRTIQQGGDTILFRLMEGEKTGMTSGPKKITVNLENGNIVYTQEDNDDNQLLSKETLYVKDDGTLSEADYWNMKKIYENCYLAKWTYRNGNYFEGSIKNVIIADTISTTATKGIFKYSNGDRFEGDISTKTVGSFFFDGTTYFLDGSTSKGNWLEKYKLSDSQWAKVYQCPNPSSARELAQKLMRSNYYQEYEYTGLLEFFDPSKEDFIFAPVFSDIYLTYDKTKKRYSCKYGKNDIIKLEFAVDKNGFRTWEIVYNNNNKPEFINEFTWYSNGIIESVKSYYYSTKKIYLSCNFFSDGTLRSAYQYGPGNSGENILRKSKESHPTYGGFTCKLYDLNGQYERSIRWSIGDALLGGSRQYKISKLDFDKLKPIEQESKDLVQKAKEVKTKDGNNGKKVFDEVEKVKGVKTKDENIDNKVFDEVEKMPEFPGGQASFLLYLNKNIKYPVVAEENGIQGRVICTFIVERDGSITDVKVVKSIDPALDKEAVRVLSKMPKWKPGMEKGSPVRVKYSAPVQFKLQ